MRELAAVIVYCVFAWLVVRYAGHENHKGDVAMGNETNRDNVRDALVLLLLDNEAMTASLRSREMNATRLSVALGLSETARPDEIANALLSSVSRPTPRTDG